MAVGAPSLAPVDDHVPQPGASAYPSSVASYTKIRITTCSSSCTISASPRLPSPASIALSTSSGGSGGVSEIGQSTSVRSTATSPTSQRPAMSSCVCHPRVGAALVGAAVLEHPGLGGNHAAAVVVAVQVHVDGGGLAEPVVQPHHRLIARQLATGAHRTIPVGWVAGWVLTSG